MGEHMTLIDWDVYEKHVLKADIAGTLVPKFMTPDDIVKLFSNSMLFLRAGRHPDGAKHHTIKAKMMQALGAKNTLKMAPRIERAARRMLDKCVEETKGPRGEVSMTKHIERFCFENAVVSSLGDLSDDEVDELYSLMGQVFDGFMCLIHIDLPFLCWGKTLEAYRKIEAFVRQRLASASADGSTRNILKQLTSACKASGNRGLTEEEITDTVVNMVLAGMPEPANTVSFIILHLWKSPDWASRIAEEARSNPWTVDSSIQNVGSVAYRFVLEVIRHTGQTSSLVYRKADGPLDLGKYGTLPAGWTFGWWYGEKGWRMGEDFNPDRWDAKAVKEFVGFGSHGPHYCPAKEVTYLQLEILAQVLSSGDYALNVLDQTRVEGMFGPTLKGGCRAQVSHTQPMTGQV